MKDIKLEGLTTFKNGVPVYDRPQEKINKLIEILERMSLGGEVYREKWDEYPMYWEEGYERMAFWVDLEHPLILKTIQEDDIVLKRGRVIFEKISDPTCLGNGMKMGELELAIGVHYPESLLKIHTYMTIGFWPDEKPSWRG